MDKLSFLLISFTCCFVKSVKCDQSSLVLVHCVFRHGNRTIDPPTYPTDPHTDETYYPFGFGQLTNAGKNIEYQLGRYLRGRYGKILGSVWTPDVLEALSSDYDRTKMSLQLVLAGLYPPAFTPLSWSNRLDWQPIPYNYKSKSTDHILGYPLYNCPNYKRLYNAYLKSMEGRTIQNRYTKLFKYLSENTGEKITTNEQVLFLYTNLEAQRDFGLNLPSWTKPVYPEILEEAAGEQHLIATATDQLRRLSAGFLLKKIIQDTLVPKNRKLFLYSAHDTTIGPLLATLKVFYPHNPSYGSFVLFELHKINDEYGFKLFYQNYKEKLPILLKIPNCEEFCPFSKFIRLTKRVLPQENSLCDIESE